MMTTRSVLFAQTAVQRKTRRGLSILVTIDLTKNHTRLLDAWGQLKQKENLTPRLHVTIPPTNQQLISQIEQLKMEGVQIQNHGTLSHEAALDLTARSTFVVFPSLLETIGLGLIEGVLLECKILAPEDRAFHEIVMPSAVFDPLDTKSIMVTVAKACTSSLPVSRVRLKNQIKELVKLLVANVN